MNAAITNPKVGEVYSVRIRGAGAVDVVITSFRFIQRGRCAGMKEYSLAPMKREGKTYGFTVKGEKLLQPKLRKHTRKQIDSAMGKMEATAEEVQDRKYKRADAGYKAIQTHDIQPDDEVLVAYSNATRWEVVSRVNHGTGKVAIVRPDIEARIERNAENRDQADRINFHLPDAKMRAKKESLDRWIPATLVREVRKGVSQ